MKKLLISLYNLLDDKYMRLLLFLIMPFIIIFATSFRIDNDFWFIINTGREILNNGFITIEPFTIHEGLNFIPQQWLCGIIFYFIYNKFSVYGMLIFVIFIGYITIFLLYRICLLVSSNNYKLSFLITCYIGILIGSSFMVTRPYLFDIVFLLLEIYLLELYVIKGKNKYLYVLPIISILMINLHASIWPMLFVVFIPYFIGCIKNKYFKDENYKLKPLILVFIIMFMCSFINPYGLDMLFYLFNSYGYAELNEIVGEMNPITVFVIPASLFILVTLLSFYYVCYKRRKIKIRYLLLFLGSLLLAFLHMRGCLFLFIFGFLSLIDNFNIRREKNNVVEENSILILFFYVFIFIICILLFIFNVNVIDEKESEYYKIVELLDNNASKDIKLYTGYNTGPYFEYRGYKCYLDTRAELFYKAINKKENIMIEYYNILNNKVDVQSFLKKYDFDYLVVGINEPFYYSLQYLGYNLYYDSGKYRLYKNGSKKYDENS